MFRRQNIKNQAPRFFVEIISIPSFLRLTWASLFLLTQRVERLGGGKEYAHPGCAGCQKGEWGI
jgi:hypothetical protein